MSEELFAVEESLSPRLRWMREKGVHTRYISEESMWLAGLGSIRVDDGQLYCGESWWGDVESLHEYPPCGESSLWSGETEEEAIANLAAAKGWRLWNEPGPSSKINHQKEEIR